MQLPSWVPSKEQQLISMQEVPAERGHEKKGSRRQKDEPRDKMREPGRQEKMKNGSWKAKWAKMGCGNFGSLFRGMLV